MKQKVNILEIMGGRGTFTGATMKSAGEENVNIVGYIEADMNNAKNKNNKHNIKYKGNNCIGVYNARFGKFNYYKPKDVNYFRFEEIKDIVHIAFVSYPSYTFDRDNQDSNLEKLPNSIHNAMQILRPWCVVIDYTYTSKDENEVFLFMQHIQEFEKLGYDIFIDNYNAKDFDVPQNRERVCVVLFLKYAIDSSEFIFPRKTPTNKTCWDLIDKEYSKDESDKKFTIDVGNGKYIEGAIIFRDCGYQYVGNNLLDAFGIKNTSNTSQPYNFNILFYLDKLSRFDIAYTVYSNVFNNIEQQIKFSKDEKLTEDDFYSSLDKVPYKQIIERAGGNYGDTLFPGGNTAAGNDFYINNYIDDPDTINKSYYWELTEGTSKLVGFNLRNCDDYEDHFIESGGELDFKITSLQFYYYN